MPKISVIIPVYNVKNYVEKCLESVYNQSYKDIEVICINDCSTDGTKEVLDHYSKYPIKVIHLDSNKGVSFARNYGVSIAKGEYITFVDPDDTINREAFKLSMDEHLKQDYDFVQFNYKHITPEGNVSKPREYVENDIVIMMSDFYKYLFYDKKISNSVCCKVFKKELLDKNRMDGLLAIGEDEKYIFDLLASSTKIKVLNYWGYNYLYRETSVINNSDYLKWMGLYYNGHYFIRKVSIDNIKYVECRNVKWYVVLLLKIPFKDKENIKLLKKDLKYSSKRLFFEISSKKEIIRYLMIRYALYPFKYIYNIIHK